MEAIEKTIKQYSLPLESFEELKMIAVRYCAVKNYVTSRYSGIFEPDYTPLEQLTKLTYLDVSENACVNDISPIGVLTNLTELGIYANRVKGMESLGNLKNLTGLFIYQNKNSEDLQFIESLTNLEYLELDYCSAIGQLDFIKGLPALEELYLTGTPVDNLDGIIEAPLLNYLYINGDGGVVHAENLFEYTQLQYIKFIDMDLRTDFTKISQMTNLRQLYLSQVEIYEEEEGSDYKQVPMDEALKCLAGLQNLQFLQVPSNGITDISVVKELPGLQALDVHDNSIDDFSVLEECEKLIWSNTNGNPGE